MLFLLLYLNLQKKKKNQWLSLQKAFSLRMYMKIICLFVDLQTTHTTHFLLLFRAITFLNHTVPDFTDNGASNFIKYGNDYYATSETNYIRKIDPVTLETQDKVTASSDLNPLINPRPRAHIFF